MSNNKMKLNIQLFNQSGDIARTSRTNSKGDIYVHWSSVPDNDTNTSTVTATAYIKRVNSGETSCTFSGTISIGGSSGSVKQYRSNWTNSYKSVGSVSKVITHEINGTKSVTITANIKTEDDATSLSGTYIANATVNLDTISRGSKLLPIDDFKITDSFEVKYEQYVTPGTGETINHYLSYDLDGTTVDLNNGDPLTSNPQTFILNSAQIEDITDIMSSPQIILPFTLTTKVNNELLGTSTQNVTISSLSQPIYRNIVKKDDYTFTLDTKYQNGITYYSKSGNNYIKMIAGTDYTIGAIIPADSVYEKNGHYQVAINGIVNTNYQEPLQVYDDRGNMLNAPVTGTTGLSKSSGNSTLESISWIKIGRLVNLRITVKTTATINSGDDIMLGSVTDDRLLPYISEVDGLGYYGGRCIAFRVRQAGTFTVRNAGYQTSGIGSGNTISASIFYISKDY